MLPKMVSLLHWGAGPARCSVDFPQITEICERCGHLWETPDRDPKGINIEGLGLMSLQGIFCVSIIKYLLEINPYKSPMVE